MNTCPSCGYCPHCGRGGQKLAPYQPYNPWQPFTTPYIGDPPGWLQGGTTWGGLSGNTSITLSNIS